jgi:hypothetical protein
MGDCLIGLFMRFSSHRQQEEEEEEEEGSHLYVAT